MFVYTTCRSCGKQLLLGSGLPDPHAQMWHDSCQRKLSPLEELEEQYETALKAMETLTEKGLYNSADECFDVMLAVEDRIKALKERPPNLGVAAVLYAGWGWPVFPLLADGETHPITGVISDGKKPAMPHGFKDTTTDVVKIRAWWERHPQHNIGVASGHRFDVVDVDLPKMRDGKWSPDGRIALRGMLADVDPKTGKGPIPDCHGIVSTASGGTHIYVLPTGAGNRGGWMPGIDIRGAGGYVVVPPSQLADGRRWEWSTPPSPALKQP